MVDDTSAVTQLVLAERQGRDRGWWEQMASCYLPESVVEISWFRGTGVEFAARSREMSASGDRARHRLGPPVVRLAGDRAMAEMSAGIEVRAVIDDTEADLVSYARLLYRCERTAVGWRIRSLHCIYERDSVSASMPGTTLEIDASELASFRPSYRCLAWLLTRRGYSVDNDLPGDDRPEQVDAMYAAALGWLDGG